MNMDISLDLYKIFCKVVKTGNMSSAAKELYISQPAVSMAVKQLEEKFGKPLLVRSSKGIKTTAEGSVIFEYLEQGLSLIDTAEKKYMEMANLEIGEIRIGAGDTIISYYLMPYIEKFIANNSSINLKVTNRTTSETIKLLKSGALDIGFINLPIEVDENLEIIECLEVRDCLIGGTKYKYLSDKMLSIKEIHKYPLLLLEKDCVTRCYLDKFANKYGVLLEPNIELGSNDLLIEFAKINLGLTFITKEFAFEKINNETIFEIPLKEDLPKRAIGLIKLKNVALSYSATNFVELLNINSTF